MVHNLSSCVRPQPLEPPFVDKSEEMQESPESLENIHRIFDPTVKFKDLMQDNVTTLKDVRASDGHNIPEIFDQIFTNLRGHGQSAEDLAENLGEDYFFDGQTSRRSSHVGDHWGPNDDDCHGLNGTHSQSTWTKTLYEGDTPVSSLPRICQSGNFCSLC